MKIVIEDEMTPDRIDREDGGCALIFSSAAYPPESEGDEDDTPGVFVKFHSWDERTKAHDVFRQFIGKKIRITIQSLDVLDQLSEI